jgi:hypothetical protein
LVAAQRRHRTRRGWGALTTLAIPDGLIDEIAAGIEPCRPGCPICTEPPTPADVWDGDWPAYRWSPEIEEIQ